ncbi:hypothetical protein ALP83_200068 [Pseudomonas syringae pv. actinidiae]|uniref:Uncharacterized protein n=1 Tax=Pseudomonas syringae pv. actinidiae TaxID=103796 RepID=A0A7Z6UHR5_PSESF|nr:hypothetical protein ALP83_200068 [Pseudomonas syringae pv. actinidiae]
MVAGVDQLPRVVGSAHYREAQQRTVRQIKTLLTVGLRPVVEPVLRLATRIQLDKGQCDLTLHDLQRLFALADKTTAQHFVVVHR